MSPFSRDSPKGQQRIGRPFPIAEGTPPLQGFRVGGFRLLELAAFLPNQPEPERSRGNYGQVLRLPGQLQSLLGKGEGVVVTTPVPSH